MKRSLLSFLFFPLLAQAQSPEFGNINVVQNNNANTSASVTLTKGAGSSTNFTIRGGNRGDYDVAFGTANDVTGGVMLSAVSQNGRNNSAGGDTIGLFYASSATDHVGTAGAAGTQYWVPIFRCANGDEVNINIATAWFPYSTYLGGFARNSTGSNGGPLNTFTGSPGITLGTHFVDNSGGLSTVNLTSLGASSANGVLLVNHGKNEDNYALSRANADGTFTVWVHDNGVNGGTYEQDPVAFVYLPATGVGSNQLVALGRVNSGATTDLAAGTFTVTKGSTGQWYLTIPGHNNSTGVLIVSPEGGGTNTTDNVVSYDWDATNSRWVIESRDLSGDTVQPTPQDGGSAGEDMFSFAFLGTSNLAPTASITAPAASSFNTPATFTIEADASDSDGTIAQVEFLRNGAVVGTDTTAPYTYTETAITNGNFSYVARAVDNLGGTGSSSPKDIAVTFDPANIPANTALLFDGNNDYVTMGAAPELNVGGPPNNGLTLECWFRKEGTGRTSGSGSGGVTAVPLFGKGRGESDGSNVDCNIFFGITTAGILVADFESQATGLNHPITATNTPIVNGTWYHAAVTYDGASSTWKMYLNGTEVGSTTASVANSVPRFDSIQHFGIGTAMNSAGVTEGAFHGVIDEARVWNFARSAADIAAAKDLELAAGTGLIGRFGLNEGTGSSTGNSVAATVGTLMNNPTWVAGAPFATANISPSITLTAPLNNATAIMPQPVTFTADASDVGGSIAKVEFFVNGNKVGEDTDAPFSYDWTPPAIGTYSVSARAQDNLGARTLSTAASLEMLPNPNQSPVVTPSSPANLATVSGSNTTLSTGLADPEGDAMTVTFYGRRALPVTPQPDFSFVAIPDTQYYSEGSPGRANTVSVEQLVGTFGEQTQWVVNNRNTRNIAFVSHMGDIVENGNFGGNPIQWERASAAMGKLENPATTLLAHGIPYGIAPGNHDIDPIGSYDSGSTLFYNQYFGVSRFAGRNYYGGNYGSDNTNSYYLFSAAGLDFIVIHFAYDTTPNQPILDWADALLKAHPDRRAICTTHHMIGQGNPATFSTQGLAIYNNLKDNPNLFLLLGGHIHAEGRRSDVFEGRTVYSVLSDYQGLQNGGNGFLRTFTFSPTNNRIRVESWSPTLNRAAALSDGLPHFDGTFDLNYDMQTPVTEWSEIGTVNVSAGGTTASVNWTGLEAGKDYEWYAAASDSINVVSSSVSRFSTAPGAVPTVTLDAPLTGTEFSSPATINLSATASDTDGTIIRVDFYESGTKIGEDTTAPYEFAWTPVPAGNYSLTAVAIDDSGLAGFSSASSIVVNLGDLLPLVTLTSPTTGTLVEAPADITLTADASDNEGPVTKVEFFSGSLTPVLLGEDTTEPFSLTLEDVGPGTYSYSAKVTDSAGQTSTSAFATISVFTETTPPTLTNVSVGNFDPPTWTVAQTSPAPRNFNLPGTDLGDVELRINGASVPFNNGIALATSWGGPASTGNSSNDNLVQPYANGSGNLFVSVLDNANNNAPDANPGTSEQTSGVSVAFLPYIDGFSGASVNTSGVITASNLPAGVTVTRPGGTGNYRISGLSTAGNLLAFTNGDSGTLADNICNVRILNGQWQVQTRDNGNFTQENEFSFVYLPPSTRGVFAGKVSAAAAVTHTNASATFMGVTAAVDAGGLDLTFGDGSVINPSTAALFLTADTTTGGDANAAADNLISWSANGNSFRIFTQDLVEITGAFEAIDLRFVAIPFAPNLPQLAITATDSTAGEYGADQSLRFTLSRTGETFDALNVTLAASGSATSGADYSGFTATVTIPANQASVEIPLTVLADQLAESAESVTLTISTNAAYTIGSSVSATAGIADSPAQDWFFQNIADPAKRGAADDADDDRQPNIVEYFMGTLPADGSSTASVSAEVSAGSAIFRFKRALNRPSVVGVVEWSTNLRDWYRSGQSDGGLTVNINESTNSAPMDDPQLIDATATNPTGPLPELLFFRLSVSE